MQNPSTQTRQNAHPMRWQKVNPYLGSLVFLASLLTVAFSFLALFR
ncbi:hypothetical protein [Deinococcus cellulosilyticus]|uniref:Uncharacterized protein n=1 Tax=Deinococcus cellulosilyticus (strain DSM 18568 / NBRC 106333 / KACC 11606 / 5516J-15) TaxID=1223518 RepID=A0A511MVU6_DEIC1|nr:hypothetical protein [Deinococcus cellulosilyticus]GEM44692.1 hypothetical protein DC3_03270 [Deinococcus cellulosilyticus NBRC 106333 = KACC 11606]